MTNEPEEPTTPRLPRPRRREFPAAPQQPGPEIASATAAATPRNAAEPSRAAQVTPAPLTEPLNAATPPLRNNPPTRPNGRPIRQRMQQPAPAPPAWEEEDYDDWEDDYAPRQESLLRNPYVLAALAVGGAIVMAIIVVILAGGGGGGGVGGAATQEPITPVPGGVTVDSIATSTVRKGPGTEFDAIGTLSRGQKVTVTGRDQEARWFEIVFPQNSTLRGWVPATALKVSDLNPAALPIASVTPIARPTVATSTPEPQPTEEATATPTVTGTAEPGPDLAISFVGNSCAAGSDVNVVIRNAGTSTVSGRSVSITITAGNEVHSTSTPLNNLGPGESVTLATGAEMRAPRTSAAMTLLGSPQDVNPANNAVECAVQGGGGTTPTPVATTPAVPTPTRTPTVVTP